MPAPNPEQDRERLSAILQYLEDWDNLVRKPVTTVEGYRAGLAAHQHEVENLPGVRLQVQEEDGEDTWLTVSRLAKEAVPPLPEELKTWLTIRNHPDSRPKWRKRKRLDGETLDTEHDPEIPAGLPQEIRAEFLRYLNNEWQPWSEREAPRRKSIQLYEKLFSLLQTLEHGNAENPIELVWGMSLAVWKPGGRVLRHPLLTQEVEILPLEGDMILKVRPTSREPQVETDPFLSLELPGLADFEKTVREQLDAAEVTPLPFDASSFEFVGRTAAERLDTRGVFSADPVTELPKPESSLFLCNNWVLFARRRSSSFLIQDLARLRERVAETGVPEGAPAHLVREPADDASVEDPIPFRGLSTAGTDGDDSMRELYFPKPFNEEQVEIIRRLETQPGVVVQGPPGTGKTHTIANVICHYLAEGKRVLVTSKGEAALSVLRQQIPEAIRPLTVSLLTNERQGKEQLEQAVNHINAQKSVLRPDALERSIEDLEERINAAHGRIAGLDAELRDWAKRNVSTCPAELGGLNPEQLAHEVAEGREKFDWFPDSLDADSENAPPLSDREAESLAEARREIGGDLASLETELPAIDEFPKPEEIATAHEVLREKVALDTELAGGDWPRFDQENSATIEKARTLRDGLGEHRALRAGCRETWQQTLATWCGGSASATDSEVARAVETLLEEILDHRESLNAFLTTAVETPEGAAHDESLREAVNRAAEGRRPFPALAFGKTDAKRRFQAIRLDGSPPSNVADWDRVRKYFDLMRDAASLAARWNSLGSQLRAPAADGTSLAGFRRLMELAEDADRALRLALRHEKDFEARVLAVFPDLDRQRIESTEAFLAELEAALNSQLRRSDLEAIAGSRAAWLSRLETESHPIATRMRDLLRHSLGDAHLAANELEKAWRGLRDELARLHDLWSQAATLRSLTNRIARAGAPVWAERLRTEPFVGGESDPVFPEDWREAWQWSQRRGYLESIDGRRQIQRLTNERAEAERQLAADYEAVIEKRTWLGLVRQLSGNPAITRAIVAYVKAIRNMTKSGKGKRDVALRHSAREAMELASQGVPCWIMPQWRVSESLPSRLGEFDLVIIDEASQSDAWAVPSLVRGKRVLIVGDDKQVGPQVSFASQRQVDHLMERLQSAGLPRDIRNCLDPKESAYDLGELIFSGQTIRLREHFRCAEPIIQFSNRLCYDGEIKCVRVPRATERLLPTLVDVHVVHGARDLRRKINAAEAFAIVDEIETLVSDPTLADRSIGVVSLLGIEQAKFIFNHLLERIGEEKYLRHRIRCGDARTFQGSEADIIFLSAVDDGESASVMTENLMDNVRRMNVATSRARDRLYFFHSFTRGDLKAADLRGRLLDHFRSPLAGLTDEEIPSASGEEDSGLPEHARAIRDALKKRRFRVLTKVRVGTHLIDLVVEGDEGRRLAVACDGGEGVSRASSRQWLDTMAKQRLLERAGWTFWRCWAASWMRDPEGCLEDLINALTAAEIRPVRGRKKAAETDSLVDFRTVSTVRPAVEQTALPADFDDDLDSFTGEVGSWGDDENETNDEFEEESPDVPPAFVSQKDASSKPLPEKTSQRLASLLSGPRNQDES